jgi:hypothetical protein
LTKANTPFGGIASGAQCWPPSSLLSIPRPETKAKRLSPRPPKVKLSTPSPRKPAAVHVAPRSELFHRPEGALMRGSAAAHRVAGSRGSTATAVKLPAKRPRLKGVQTAPKLAVFHTVRPRSPPRTAR